MLYVYTCCLFQNLLQWMVPVFLADKKYIFLEIISSARTLHIVWNWNRNHQLQISQEFACLKWTCCTYVKFSEKDSAVFPFFRQVGIYIIVQACYEAAAPYWRTFNACAILELCWSLALAMSGASATSATATTTAAASVPLEIIIPCVVGGVLVIAIIVLSVYCCLKIKKKRAYEGKYSPAGNEEKGGVRMNDMMNVLPMPPPERLIWQTLSYFTHVLPTALKSWSEQQNNWMDRRNVHGVGCLSGHVVCWRYSITNEILCRVRISRWIAVISCGAWWVIRAVSPSAIKNFEKQPMGMPEFWCVQTWAEYGVEVGPVFEIYTNRTWFCCFCVSFPFFARARDLKIPGRM